MRWVIFLLFIVVLPVAVSARQEERRTMIWQGVERAYVFHLPAQEAAFPMPLVVALAGLTQDLDSLRHWLPIDPVADQHGFVVAYPEALGKKWSYWQGSGVLLPGQDTEEVDDVGFVAAVVETLVKEGVADSARVYVTGLSRGALLSWTLACQRADLFAAVAPLSSAMTAWQMANCHPSRPLPIVAVDGTEDPVQFYDGFIYAPPTPRLTSVPETMAFWWRLNDCAGERATALPHRHDDDRTRVVLLEWTDCRRGHPVMLYRVGGGGHQPPSLTTEPAASREVFGRRNRDIETAEEVWKAFEALQGPKRHEVIGTDEAGIKK